MSEIKIPVDMFGKKVNLQFYKCERCEYVWSPKQKKNKEKPTICPNCNSPYWNKPRKELKKK